MPCQPSQIIVKYLKLNLWVDHPPLDDSNLTMIWLLFALNLNEKYILDYSESFLEG